jgi:hypothetical protein
MHLPLPLTFSNFFCLMCANPLTLVCCPFFFSFFRFFMILCGRSTGGRPPRNPRNLNDQNAVVLYCRPQWFVSFFFFFYFLSLFLNNNLSMTEFRILLQIFFDLVRQINRRTPENPPKKNKKKCTIL